jgi:hypothetical protein
MFDFAQNEIGFTPLKSTVKVHSEIESSVVPLIWIDAVAGLHLRREYEIPHGT